MARRVTHARFLVLLLTVALMGVFVARVDAGTAITFNPVYVPSVVSPVAGAHTNTTVTFSLPANNFNFSAVIGFVPDDMGVGTCAANSNGASLAQACADQMIPDGAILGNVVADATLGLANGPCNNAIDDITWNMMDATTSDPNNPLTHVIFEDDPLDADVDGEQFEDADSDGIPNGVEMYPAYLSRLLTTPGPFGTPGATPLQPMLRSYGQTVVAGTKVSLQFLLFPPGITVNGLALPAAAGYSLVTVLQNIGDPGAISAVQSISDNCSPLNSFAQQYGVTLDNPASAPDEGGVTVLTVPDPGTYEAHALLFSNRDEDTDGIENQMDTCSYQGNTPGWDPTLSGSPGDADQDGIPAICDPNDNQSNIDQDSDGFENRLDNCPVINNGPPDTPAAQDDVDRDGIGDACDPAPTTPSAAIAVWPPTYPNTKLGDVTVTGPIMGDTNCSASPTIGVVNSIDSLQVLRRNASVEPYGACANNPEANVNCDGSINSIDALLILRYGAGLSVTQNEPCADIGTPLP